MAGRVKTYDTNYIEVTEQEEAPTFVASGQGAGSDEWEPDLDPEFLETLIAQDDGDALTVSSFEQEPELQTALVTFLEARGRLRDKHRNRGFWPTGSGSKSKGGKAKGFQGRSFGKGKKGRDREALLNRIARSNCRICG